MLGYFQNFLQHLDLSALLDIIQQVLAVLLCLTVHETCHGLAALALGDPTAKRMHRLSFNPLHHIDWLGLLSMFLCGFGWAKAVPVDMRYFKNPKAGMALTALAGPASNFLLALAALVLCLPHRGAARGGAERLFGVAVLFSAEDGYFKYRAGAVQPGAYPASGRVENPFLLSAGAGLLHPHAL